MPRSSTSEHRDIERRVGRLETKVDSIDSSVNQVKLDMNSLKIKFNDELKIEVGKQQTFSRWKLALIMAFLSGAISFVVAFAAK